MLSYEPIGAQAMDASMLIYTTVVTTVDLVVVVFIQMFDMAKGLFAAMWQMRSHS